MTDPLDLDAESPTYTPPLHVWERPIGDPERQDRDIIAAPYDRQEQRAVNFLWDAGMGGGDDPVGFLIASTAYSQAIVPGAERYRHKKRGTTYTVVGEAQTQVVGAPIEEGSTVTVYRSDTDGSLWVRPTAEFHDGRFERLPDAAARPDP